MRTLPKTHPTSAQPDQVAHFRQFGVFPPTPTVDQRLAEHGLHRRSDGDSDEEAGGGYHSCANPAAHIDGGTVPEWYTCD